MTNQSKYTVEQIEKVGNLLSASVAEELTEHLRATSPYIAHVALKGFPPSRLNLLRWRVRGYRERLATALSVLRGTHDCGDDW